MSEQIPNPNSNAYPPQPPGYPSNPQVQQYSPFELIHAHLSNVEKKMKALNSKLDWYFFLTIGWSIFIVFFAIYLLLGLLSEVK